MSSVAKAGLRIVLLIVLVVSASASQMQQGSEEPRFQPRGVIHPRGPIIKSVRSTVTANDQGQVARTVNQDITSYVWGSVSSGTSSHLRAPAAVNPVIFKKYQGDAFVDIRGNWIIASTESFLTRT